MFKLNQKVFFINGKKKFSEYLSVIVLGLVALVLFLAPIKLMAEQDFIFNNNLKIGNLNQDIKELQKYLNNDDFILAKVSFGSLGKETTYFGNLTRAALIKFQKANKITPAVGFFGPITRGVINKKISDLVEANKQAEYYSIGGNISGLAGEATLQNNGKDNITVEAGDSGDFTFPTEIIDGGSYFVTVTPEYSGYKCYLENGSIVDGANVTDVQLDCELLDSSQGGGPIDEYNNENSGGGSSVVTYNLNYVAGINGTIAGAKTQKVNSGNDGATVTAVTAKGYQFVKWDDEVMTPERTDLNITANKTVTAIFTSNQYILKYVTGDNGTITGTSTQTINYGTNGSEVIAVPNVNYRFLKWSDDLLTATRTDVNIIEDKTLTADFVIDIFTLNYFAGVNGTITGTSTQTVNYDLTGTEVTATPNIGYRFINWSDNNSVTATRTDANVKANVNATSTFAINTLVLTYLADSNGTIIGTSTQTINYGANGSEVIAVPNAGFNFINWSDSVLTATRTDLNVIDNISVTANFTTNQYALTSSAGENGSITPSETVNYGMDKTFTITPATNYYVADVLVDNASVGAVASYTFTNVIATHTISATFAINTLVLTYLANANGTITGTSTQIINYGTNGSEVIAVPNVGYHFVNWSDGIVTTKRTDLNIVANISVTANFAINVSIVCGVSTVKGAGLDVLSYGTVLGVDGKCWLDRNLGATQVATAINDSASYGWLYQWGRGTDGHQIITSGITVGPSNVPSNNFITGGSDWHTRNDSLWQGVEGINNPCPTGFRLPTSAEWSAVINPVGTVNDITNSATAFNSALKLTTAGFRWYSNATLNGRGNFTGYWSGSISGMYAYYLYFNSSYVNPASSDNRAYGLSVRCLQNQNASIYTLTYTAGDNGVITGTSTQVINYGANGSEVIAVPNVGYHFVNWSDGIITASRTDLNVIANIPVIANFAINTFTLNYLAGVNGTITGTSTQTVNFGVDGTAVTAVPNANYHFVKWSDEILTATRTDLKVITNLSVTANFGVSCGVTPIIYNGYSYPTISMGGKCWFKENLRTIKYNDNTDIPNLIDNTQWKNDTIGSYYTPYFDGKLYNFYAVNTGKLCPVGWHIPTHNEFTDLERSVCVSNTCTIDFPYDVTTISLRGSADEASKLTAGTPKSVGFNVIFPGYRHMDGWYTLWNEYAVLWTSTIDGKLAWARYLYANPIYGIWRDKFEKASGLSVRCVEN